MVESVEIDREMDQQEKKLDIIQEDKKPQEVETPMNDKTEEQKEDVPKEEDRDSARGVSKDSMNARDQRD